MAVDHNNPQSRTEEILIATIDGTEYDKIPQSRLEELLLELKEAIEEGGGGGGTTNYNQLSNKPQINGVTLSGEMTAADLSLVLAEVGKGLSTNDYSDEEKAKVTNLLTAIEDILNGSDLDSFGDVEAAISAIKDGATLDSFGDVEVALLDKADTSDLGTAAAKDSTNSVTAGSTDLVESGAVKDAIDAAVASAYHHAGTKTVAQLTHDLLIAANEGNVYNITDSGTTTSDFIEGIGKQIDAGDNVGICKVGNAYMFDLLSGLEDTSIFVQKSQTAGLLKNDGTVNTTIENTVAGHTTAIDAIKDGQSIDSFADVETALATKQDTLTFDDTPTDGSNNPVKSNGVYDALANSANYIANTGVKNLIPIPFLYEDVSGDGLTYTINSDGTVEIDGTASATKRFYLIAISSDFIFEKGQTYTLTDGTSDSANNKYVLEMALFNGNTYANKVFRTANGSVTFTLPTDIEYDRVTLYFVVYNGVQLSHKLFKPMLRYSAVKNADYVYAKTNKQLTDDVALLDSEKADTDMVAADFDATASYTAGDYCIYEGKFYKFKASHSGAWSASDVDEIKIAGELSSLKSGLTEVMTTKLTVCNIIVPDTKTDVTGFLGYILGTIIEEQEGGNSYSVHGAWENHDYFIGTVYKITPDTAMAYINYGSGSNMAMYNVTYKADTYIHYKQIQYTT